MLLEIRGVFIIEITTDTKEVKERKIAAKQWDEMIILRNAPDARHVAIGRHYSPFQTFHTFL